MASGAPQRGRSSRMVTAVAGAAVAAAVGSVALRVIGVSGAPLRAVHVATVALAAAVVLARVATVARERRIWAVFGAGATLVAGAEAMWALGTSEQTVSYADALMGLGYLHFFGGLALVLRERVSDALKGFFADASGIIVCLGAVLVALLLPAVRGGVEGDTVGAVLNILMPIGDVAAASLVLTVASMSGRRMRGQEILLAAAFVVAAGADTLYVLHVAGITPELRGVLELGWELRLLLIAAAAWARPAAGGVLRVGGWWELFPTLSWMAGGGGVLVAAQLTDVEPVAVGFATATLAIAALRMVRVTREVRGLILHRREALTDELTGLPNRRALFRELEVLTRDEGRSGERSALLMLDLDGFKELNDTLGHQAGDALLEAVGQRLREVVPGLFVRLGGDEFAALVDETADPEAVADAILAALAEAVDIEGVAVSVQASVGIARFPGDAVDTGELVRCADVAMYDAKRHRSGRASYDESRDGHSRVQLALATDLRHALESEDGGGLWVAFQPQVSFGDGTVEGVEALIRWAHPERGHLSPADFLPVAARTGLMPRLTDWVLQRAIVAAAGWTQSRTPPRIAVNVSAGTLIDRRLPERVQQALDAHRLVPERLVLEVTEETVMTDPTRCRDTLVELATLGVEIAIDDFGTGHSSLAQLRFIPATELKIDRSFVLGMEDDSLNREIVTTIVGMGRRMHMRVVAEGIEDQDTWDDLAALGCHVAQGFGVARPMPADQLDEFLATHAQPAAPPDPEVPFLLRFADQPHPGAARPSSSARKAS